MNFTVSRKLHNLIPGIILALMGLAGIVGSVYLAITAPSANDDGTMPLIFGGFGMFIALGLLGVYCSLRPRIKISGDSAVYYPRWKKKRIVTLSSIAKKLTFRRADDSVPVYGLAGYAATGGKQPGMCEYVYYDADKNELLRFDSRMKNAQQLDGIITGLLNERQEQAEDE